MALPRVETTVYPITLPVSKKIGKFKPFTVKEQKILLQATKEDLEFESITGIINNCTMGTIPKLEELPMGDIEYLFMQIRAKSVGELIELAFLCENEVGGKKCDQEIPVGIDINHLKVQPEELDNFIKLEDGKIIEMQPVTLGMLAKEGDDAGLDLIMNSMKVLHDGDTAHPFKDESKEEILGFFDSLSSNDLKELKNYMDNQPRLRYEFDLECKKCGIKEHKTLIGLSNFFE